MDGYVNNMKKIISLLILIVLVTSCSSQQEKNNIWECLLIERDNFQYSETYYRLLTNGKDKVNKAETIVNYYYSQAITQEEIDQYEKLQTDSYKDIEGVKYTYDIGFYGSSEKIEVDYETANMVELLNAGLITSNAGIPDHISLEVTIDGIEPEGNCQEFVDESTSLKNDMTTKVDVNELNTNIYHAPEEATLVRYQCVDNIENENYLIAVHDFEWMSNSDTLLRQRFTETYPIEEAANISNIEQYLQSFEQQYQSIEGLEFTYVIDEQNNVYDVTLDIDYEQTDFAELVNNNIIETTADGNVPDYISVDITIKSFVEPFVCEYINQ